MYHVLIEPESSGSIVTRIWAGQLRFNTWQVQEFLPFTTVTRLALEPPPASYPVKTGDSFPGVKWPGCEADHLPPSSAKVKNA